MRERWAGCPKVSRHRVLLGATLLICLALVALWARRPPDTPAPRNSTHSSAGHFAERQEEEERWEREYERRVQRVRDTCDFDETVAMRRVWRVATNRRFGKESDCHARLCPVLVDEPRRLFFCFVPKVASTLVKSLFLNASGVPVNGTLRNSSTAFHLAANQALRRISPMYYPTTTVNRYFKMLFVRHPFDRLVSAFRDKAERPRHQVAFFYETYFDPAMRRMRPDGAPLDQITFAEFVWYLTHSPQRDWDDHWAPYWSRCDPCLVDYDFVGKLETAPHDFAYVFRKAGLDVDAAWWADSRPTRRDLTLQYFRAVPEEDLRKLYLLYHNDFELFGYSVDEFLPGNKTTPER